MGAAAVLAATSLFLFHRMEQAINRPDFPGPGLERAEAPAGLSEPGHAVRETLRVQIRQSYLAILAVGAVGTVISLACIWAIRRKLLRELTPVEVSGGPMAILAAR